MNVFPQRSQDGTSTPRTPQGTSAASTRASTIHEQVTSSSLDSSGVAPVRQPVGPPEQTDDRGDGATPTEPRIYSAPSGSPVFNGFDLYSTNGAVPVAREGRLVDGFSNHDQSPESVRASGEHDTSPQQTPPAPSATPANTSARDSQAVGTPSSLPESSLESSGFPRTPNAQSTVTDSQTGQLAVSQPIRDQRRRRRFVDWLRRHRSHRHGPWVPFIRRNWNAVSDAIREVERRGFGSSRGAEPDPVLVMDQE
ncbi:hypothetical protein MMC26_005948 [Xylographa opegraphella]|nr:hypothetical protein [Xylographa opegraphella]